MVARIETQESLAGDQAGTVWDELAELHLKLSNCYKRLGRGQISAESPIGYSPTLLEVVNEMLSNKARRRLSDQYLYQLRHCYSLLIAGRSRRALHTFSARELEKWLDSMEASPRTIRGRIQYLRSLWHFAKSRGYVERNPALALDLPVQDHSGPRIHTPEQVRAVLAAARKQGDGTAKALAIRYFGGLRSSELERLDPDTEIRLGDRLIEILAEKTKTRRRRLVSIQDNLASWLALNSPIPGDLEKRITAAWQDAGVEWPRNVTRHSFCSYHLAQFQNAAKTALEAGHSEQMLFSIYRDLVRPTEAEDYWSITP